MAVVGASRWVLHLPGCHSLKMKRSVVRSLRDRLRTRYHVSVAETDLQNRWQMAELSAAVVATDRGRAEKLLTQLDRFVRSDPRAEVVETETAYF